MLVGLLFALAWSPAWAEDCAPPAFYTSLPRDRDWYYGVARDSDTDKARELAIRNLGKQVTGDVEGWAQNRIDELAGPGQDRWEVAASVGKLLPQSTLLAGWEQDDFARCRSYSYVLVRVEKTRIERFVSQSHRFREDLAASLQRRVAKVEKEVDALSQRLTRLEQGLACFKRDGQALPEAVTVSRIVAQARRDLDAGKPAAQVEKQVARAEDAYTELEKRLSGYAASHSEAERARLEALRLEKAPELKRGWDSIESGKWGPSQAFAVLGIYRETEEFQEMRRFVRRVLARPDRKNIGQYEDSLFYQLFVADLALKDDRITLSEGEEFLKKYPKSNLFSAVMAQMNGLIAMGRMPKQAALATDPCPSR